MLSLLIHLTSDDSSRRWLLAGVLIGLTIGVLIGVGVVVGLAVA